MSKGKEFAVEIKDNATLIEAISMVDKYISEHPEESIFPLFDGYIHNYLQLLYDPENDSIYDDVGMMPYGPNRKFMPIRENINLNLYPDSVIDLEPDSGC